MHERTAKPVHLNNGGRKMKVSRLTSTLALLAIASALPAIAKKSGSPSVAHLPLWTVKQQPTAQFVPGLTAALLLTPGQQEQLAQAWQETQGSEATAAAARTLKLDLTATEAQRQAAQAVIDTAAATLRQRIDTTLTNDQKALIDRVNSVYADAGKEVWTQLEGEYASAKGDKEAMARLQQRAQEKLETDFLQKLKETLTPEQWAAMTKAAEDEKRSAEAAAKAKAAKVQ
jgi:hypothetical protein